MNKPDLNAVGGNLFYHDYYRRLRIPLQMTTDVSLLFHRMCQQSNTQSEYFHAILTQLSWKLKIFF